MWLALSAVVSAVVVAAGVALMWPPAGLVVAGVEGLTGVYVVAYLQARREGR